MDTRHLLGVMEIFENEIVVTLSLHNSILKPVNRPL